jgi:hypothetical protein
MGAEERHIPRGHRKAVSPAEERRLAGRGGRHSETAKERRERLRRVAALEAEGKVLNPKTGIYEEGER